MKENLPEADEYCRGIKDITPVTAFLRSRKWGRAAAHEVDISLDAILFASRFIPKKDRKILIVC